MKILKVLPNSLRKKIALGELKKLKNSKWRKFKIEQRKVGSIVSQAIQREAEKTIANAKKPTRSKETRELAAYAGNIALGDLKRAKEVDERTRNFSSTKEQRRQIRRIFEVQK
jgi:hypothetical protein